MAALVMRIMYAAWMHPRDSAGSVMYRRKGRKPFVKGSYTPEAGSHFRLTATSSTSPRPIRKLGREMPSIETTDTE